MLRNPPLCGFVWLGDAGRVVRPERIPQAESDIRLLG